ncbi:MAG TPA: hypothetical protein VJ939_02015 [Bacteroidales bacterium]|nr:hypothetical protein [Bacteroidales bacterium]
MKNILVLIAASILVLFLASCQKDHQTDIDEPTLGVESMDELETNPGFQWKTEQTYTLNVEVFTRGMLEVVGENDAAYLKVKLMKRTPQSFKLTVPTYENSVKLKFKDQVKTVSLDSDVIDQKIF